MGAWPYIAATIVTGAAVALVSFSSYPRIVRVTGVVDPPEGLPRVSAPLSGSIAEVFVEEGESVKQGQALLLLMPERDGRTAEGKVAGGLPGTNIAISAPASGPSPLRVTAPVDGVIAILNAVPNSYVRHSTTLVQIMDADASRTVVLFLPAQSIAHVSVGQMVKLRTESFPVQKYGHLKARITRVSAVITPAADSLGRPGASGAYVRAHATLQLNYVLVNGVRVSIPPGTPVIADVIVDEMYLYQWLLSPILRVLNGKI